MIHQPSVAKPQPKLGKRDLPQRREVRRDSLFQTLPLCPQCLRGGISGNSLKPRKPLRITLYCLSIL
jgi:hypothetical protein